MRKHGVLFVLLLVCVLFSGCGKGVKVSGKVSFSDGTPLDVGKVCFSDGNLTVYGTINEKGEYKMGVNTDGEGIPPGSYVVSIVNATKPDSRYMIKSEDDGDYPLDVTVIDLKFSNGKTSGLTCEVKGSPTYDIKVEKPPANYKPALPGSN